MSLVCTPRQFAPVANDSVHFTVEVDRTYCQQNGGIIPTALNSQLIQLETTGITLTLNDIMSTAALLFKTRHAPSSIANIQQALIVLETWQLSAQTDPISGTKRLVSVPPENEANRRIGTELLGVGVNLLVASHLYGIRFNAWDIKKANARFDYTAIYPSTRSNVEVEVRARLNRNHWTEAVQEAANKLTAQASTRPRNFSFAAVLLLGLRSKLPGRTLRTKDILIMDPSGDNTIQSQSRNLRNIMGHYIPFFERQQGLNENNFTCRFAQRLRELADSDEETFQRYLCEGDAALFYDEHGPERPWRTCICYDGFRFCGRTYAGFAWPVEIAGKKPQPGVGAYHFGLWEPIIEALRDGRIDELADLEVKSGTTEYDGKLFVLLSDGLALVWASSEAELKPDMFDGLFAPQSEINSREKVPALAVTSGS